MTLDRVERVDLRERAGAGGADTVAANLVRPLLLSVAAPHAPSSPRR